MTDIKLFKNVQTVCKFIGVRDGSSCDYTCNCCDLRFILWTNFTISLSRKCIYGIYLKTYLTDVDVSDLTVPLYKYSFLLVCVFLFINRVCKYSHYLVISFILYYCICNVWYYNFKLLYCKVWYFSISNFLYASVNLLT